MTNTTHKQRMSIKRFIKQALWYDAYGDEYKVTNIKIEDLSDGNLLFVTIDIGNPAHSSWLWTHRTIFIGPQGGWRAYGPQGGRWDGHEAFQASRMKSSI